MKNLLKEIVEREHFDCLDKVSYLVNEYKTNILNVIVKNWYSEFKKNKEVESINDYILYRLDALYDFTIRVKEVGL